MIQKIKKLIISLTALFALAMPVALPATVLADCSGATTGQQSINCNLGCGSNLDLTQQSCDTSGGGTTLSQKIATVINVFSAIIAAVSVIMIIYGGFRYITSGGKEEGVKGAKSTILYALIGLVIVALAQIIVKFVLNKATS